MRLEYLEDHKNFIPIIADWFYEEWKHLNPARTREDVIDTIEMQLSKSVLPTIFIGLDNTNQLMGTVTLRVFEMENYEHLSPWLSSLYVPTGKRHKGIGSLLVKELIIKAKELNINSLYLFTEKHEDWYNQMGWSILEKVIHRGYQITIMENKLT